MSRAIDTVASVQPLATTITSNGTVSEEASTSFRQGPIKAASSLAGMITVAWRPGALAIALAVSFDHAPARIVVAQMAQVPPASPFAGCHHVDEDVERPGPEREPAVDEAFVKPGHVGAVVEMGEEGGHLVILDLGADAHKMRAAFIHDQFKPVIAGDAGVIGKHGVQDIVERIYLFVDERRVLELLDGPLGGCVEAVVTDEGVARGSGEALGACLGLGCGSAFGQ